MKLVIASGNVHKIRELRTMLKEHKELDLYSLYDFPNYTPPPEVGLTFEENAAIKAKDAAKHLNEWALADDTGLVVPALDGAPGLFSARYAREGATDKENREKLLQKMASLKEHQRTAYFECCLVVASPDGLIKVVHGIVEGAISLKERGSSGFGYDPLFVKTGYGKTFAEMSEETKNRTSPRRKAVDKLIPYLSRL